MKKLFPILLGIMLVLCLCLGSAETQTATVYVTIANGEIETPAIAVELTDTDGDGAYTVSDALYLAHEAAYEGGAEAGYGTADTDWGLSLSKLWGVENGGSYGYYVNNAMAWSLTDALNDGDYITAYVYTDLIGWSDTYSFFDKNTIEAKAGDEVTLKLSVIGFDESFNAVELPLAGATIVIDGEATEYITGEDGSVTFVLPEGAKLISAASDTITLVPPLCIVAE